jgi:hypothetical protein
MASKSVKKRLIAQAGITAEDLMQPSSLPKRYSIIGDDSGHEYFVLVEQEKEFYEWVASFEESNEEKEYNGPDFEENRIDGRFTFTDPRNE